MTSCNNSELQTPVLLLGLTPRLIPESPICMTLYHSISNPRIPPLLLVMSSHLYFLLSIASHYLTCYSLPSHQRCLFVLSYSSLSFLNPCPYPLDFPYTFTIPSRLGKSFVPFSYRLQTI